MTTSFDLAMQGLVEVHRDSVLIGQRLSVEEAIALAVDHANTKGSGRYIIKSPDRQVDVTVDADVPPIPPDPPVPPDYVIGIEDPALLVPLHERPKPGSEEVDADLTFKAVIKRVTEPGESGLTSQSPYFWTFYSQLPLWDAGGTLLMVNHNGRPALYEHVGGAYVVRRGDLVNTLPFSNGWRWSPTEPGVFYYLGNEHNKQGVIWPTGVTPHAKAVFCRAVINRTTWAVNTQVVAHWPQYERLTKNPSYEAIKRAPGGDLWVGLTAETTSGGPYFAIGLNISVSLATGKNAETQPLDLTPASAVRGITQSPWRQPDGVTVSPLCDRMLIQWGAGMGRWEGMEAFAMDWTFIKQVQPSNGHYDLCIGDDGKQYQVFYQNGGSGSPGISKASIDGPHQVIAKLLNWQDRTAWRAGIHVSAQHSHIDGSPFVVVSADMESVGPLVPFEQEVLLLYLDSTPAVPHVLRLCQTANSIKSSPLATISRDGTRVAFGSDWRAGGGTTGDVYVVLIEKKPVDPEPPTGTALTLALAKLTPGYGSESWSSADDSLHGGGSLTARDVENCSVLSGFNPARGVEPSTYWSASVPWDEEHGRLLAFCSPPGAQAVPTANTLVEYEEESDHWSRTRDPAAGRVFAHCLDNNAYHAGRLYKFDWARKRFFEFDLATRTVTREFPGIAIPYQTPTAAIHPTLYPGGALVVVSENSGLSVMRALNIATGAWATLASGLNVGDFALSHYHPLSQAVIFGGGVGGGAGRRFYALQSDGTIVALAAVPVEMSVHSGTSHAISLAHPTAASSLVYHSNGDIYGLRHVPHAMAALGTIPEHWRWNAGTPDALMTTIAASIPGRGILFVQERNVTSNVAFLHRPS